MRLPYFVSCLPILLPSARLLRTPSPPSFCSVRDDVYDRPAVDLLSMDEVVDQTDDCYAAEHCDTCGERQVSVIEISDG